MRVIRHRRKVRSLGLRIVTGVVVLLAVTAVVPLTAGAAQAPNPRTSTSSEGALPQDATTSDWIPSDAPMPASLPSGLAPTSMTLYATSCSSSAFCLSVGEVFDSITTPFRSSRHIQGVRGQHPVAPTPENATTNQWFGAFYSVSCPADGQCAAVGLYDAYSLATGVS